MTATPPADVRSMTGFGAAERTHGPRRVVVEVRSVNNRHLKFSSRLPGSLERHAKTLEDRVRASLARGSVWLSVVVRADTVAAPGRLVPEVIEDYRRQVTRAGLPQPTMDALLRLPGVVETRTDDDEEVDDAERDLVLAALDAALADLVEMRRTEGAHLTGVLLELMDDVATQAGEIEARVPLAVVEHRDRLRTRLDALLDGDEVPEDVLAREVALLADKTDVAEEVARLRSHVAQVRDALARGGEVGRRLDFLAQEMGREANTIGSKSQDAQIGAAVVDLKLAVERLKEQAANLE